MNAAYRSPGRDIDDTVVRTTEIHEAAETKRKAIEQREETKRLRTKQLGPTPYVAVVAVLGIVALAGAISYYNHLESKAPPRPTPCAEWAEIVCHADSNKSCPGGHIMIDPVKAGETVLLRCVCGAADGGT